MNPFDIESVGNPVRAAWDRLHRLPGGKKIFSQFVGRAAPYTGTIGATVLELRPGFARTQMRDRKIVRNHLRSVHAIALANFAELTSGVAMVYGLPDDARGILKGLSMEYLKKARGTLTGTCEFEPPATSERQDYVIEPQIFDASGQLVARAKAHWLIGPKR